MNPFLYYEAVQALEREFDASRLTFGGVNWWMAVKLLMLGRFPGEAARRTFETFNRPSHMSLLFDPDAELQRRERQLPAPVVVDHSALIFPADEVGWGEAPALFFETPVDYTTSLGGVAVNRIADGFVEAFGPRVAKICRFAPTVARAHLRCPTALLHIAPSAITFDPGEARRFRVAVRDLCSLLHRLRPAFAIAQATLLQSAINTLRAAQAHEGWLRAAAPKVLFVHTFPSFEKMAVLLAARRVGLRTVDVQHGYMDAWSINNGLPLLADGARHLYPDVMWCWGEPSRAALSADRSLAATGVTAITGGDVWGALRQREVAVEARRLADQLQADRYDRRVLVAQQIETLTLAPSRGYLPQIVHDAIVQAPRDWLWMIRLHPRSRHLIEPVTASLEAEGIGNFDVAMSSRAPIEAALSVADVYATSFSVSAFEANALDRPVLLFDDIGSELFAREIAAGAFVHAPTADALVAAAATRGPPPVRLGYYTWDLDLSRSAFERLLTAAPPAPEPAPLQEQS